MKKKIFKGLSVIAFQIGVNVIGLPIFHKHELRFYKTRSWK